MSRYLILCLFFLFFSCKEKECCDFLESSKRLVQLIDHKDSDGILKMVATKDQLNYNNGEVLQNIIEKSNRYLDTIKNSDKLLYEITINKDQVFGYAVVNVILHRDSVITDFIEVRYFGPNSPFPGKIQNINYFRSNKNLFKPVPTLQNGSVSN